MAEADEGQFLPVTEEDEYVFHYTRGRTALEDILPDKKLRLSPFCDTNDPREAKDWSFSFTSSEQRLFAATSSERSWDEVEQAKIRSTDITTEAKRQSKLLCTTLDDRDAQSAESTLYARGFARARMWAQYADRHKGVCLAFRRRLLDEQIRKQFDSNIVYCARVKYSNDDVREAFFLSYDKIESSSLEDTVAEHLAEYGKDLFFHKVKDWESENEYRWLVVTPGNAEPNYVDCGASLCAVILGVDFPDAYDARVIQLCGKNVAIQRLGYRNYGYPELWGPVADQV